MEKQIAKWHVQYEELFLSSLKVWKQHNILSVEVNPRDDGIKI